MNSAIIYIGFAQALYSSLLFFLKRPLKIADVILALWLIAISAMFGLNIYQEVNQIIGDSWTFSLPLLLSYPPFLFLYSKYITTQFDRFRSKDLIHGLPILLIVLIITIFGLIRPNDELFALRSVIGYFFMASLWGYGILSILIVIKHKKQLKNNYSYSSSRINLTWLMVVVISYIVVFNLTVVVSLLTEYGVIQLDADQVRNPILLAYVYVIGIWGLRQHQLSSDGITLNSVRDLTLKSSSDKYQKSGLKPDLAKTYVAKLVNYMNASEAWKDPELSIEKLAMQTQIPRHYITQVLNENLGKNFYTFVNEYRTAHAKKLIVSPDYQAWSFVGIANECGFNSKTAFNNFFKKASGMTPSEYKSSQLAAL